ncbi:MAG: hypothetical protein ACREE6_12855 [Limisphaerales bacterium]
MPTKYRDDGRPSAWARTEKRLKIIRRNLTRSDAEIGRMFGVTRAAVFELRMRYGIPKVRSNTQHKARLVEMAGKMPSGLTITEAAHRLNLSEQQAYYYGRSAGYRFKRKKGKHERSDYWKATFKTLKPGLTLREVAAKLKISYIYAIQLCQKHKYKTRWSGSSRAPRLPVRTKGR